MGEGYSSLDCPGVIDSHTHLFLCEGAEDELVARRARGRGGADAQRRPRRGLQPDRDRAGRAPRGGLRHGRLAPDLGGRVRRRARGARSCASPSTRRCGRSARPGSTTTARRRPGPSSGAPSRRRSRSPASAGCRSSSTPATRTERRPRPTRSSRSSTPAATASRSSSTASSPPGGCEDAIERGWYCSFSGIVTYPRSDDLREAAAQLPDELLLVETDAPYLAPQPVRGKPNQPAHVVDTARAVAEVRGETYEQLERTVEANARTLFEW